jgi:hypothetical protein
LALNDITVDGKLFLPSIKQVLAQHYKEESKSAAEDNPEEGGEEFPETEYLKEKQNEMMNKDKNNTIIDEPFDILVLE